MEEKKKQILSEEEWVKLFRACDNDCEHAAAHVLAMAALVVKHKIYDLIKEVEKSENQELLQDDEVKRRICEPYRIEIENFHDSGTNAVISIEFVPPKSPIQHSVVDMSEVNDSDLPRGFNKDEIADMCQLVGSIAEKPEFQKTRIVEIGVSALPLDSKTGKVQGNEEEFHCAVFDANKFELVRKNEVGLPERHFGDKKPVFH